MEEIGTDTIRKLASRWTLAGDEKLLTILQNTHQRLLARCQETNCQLEQMTTALDDTSICLQNVNNQFMSLSSSQFIESRVYDDDVDMTTDNTAAKETPVPSPPDELSMLKRSVAVINGNHEVITIIDDSDTSDSEDELPDRQVLKPKDVYEDRPLPYIIGSEPWKNKWHAGLVVEDSDTDSSTSKVERDSDQYSHSEPEDYAPGSVVGLCDSVPGAHGANLSESSSELPLDATLTSKPTPSDVASEIARRLGSGVLPPKMADREPEYEEPARSTVTKIYKPQEPIASTIFPEEPPPLDEQTDSETDIFAELHRNQPYRQPYRRGDVAQDLFGREEEEDGDIFSDFANQPAMTKPTSLFESGPKPHMFDNQRITESPSKGQTKVTEQSTGNIQQHDSVDSVNDKAAKKPVGGISLFGTNKGAENIGAAILRRHQRQSSSSDEGSGSEIISERNNKQETTREPEKQQAKKEKDIFDDLFAKNEIKKAQKTNNTSKGIIQEIQKKNEEKNKKDTPKPVDLFSDNLFDDIDDIFTTNVVKTTKNSKNTIFEDDDTLFSEIADHKVDKPGGNVSKSNMTGLFDSDDDLFSEKPKVNSKPEPNKIFVETTEPTTVNKVVQPNIKTNTASLFDDDDDKLFSDTKISDAKTHTADKNTNLTKPVEPSKIVFNSPLLFDDDDDSSDLFKETMKSPSLIINKLSVDKGSHNNTNKTEVKSIGEKTKPETLRSNEVMDAVSNKSDNKASNHMEKTNPSSTTLVSSVINKEVADNIDSTVSKQDPTSSMSSNNDFSIENRLKDTICHTNNISNEHIETRDSNVDNNATTINMYNNSETSEHNFNVTKVKNEVDDINQTPSLNINKTHIENNKAHINIHDIINDSSDESIFAPQQAKSEVSQSNNDDNSNKALNSDIFSDILYEPPVFEKPKEPKKSKNVNALFDDDSDDESLFFKKDDVVSDDNHEEFIPSQNKLLDIFTDLPPEEDVNKINDRSIYNDLFSSSTLPKNKLPEREPIGIPTVNNKTSTSKVILDQEKSELKSNIGDIFKLLSEETPEKAPPMSEEDAVNKTATILKTAEQQNLNEKPEAGLVHNILSTLVENKVKTPPVNEIVNDDDIFKSATNSNTRMANNYGYSSDDNDSGLFQSLPVQLCKPSQLSETSDQKNDYKSDDEQCQSLPNIDILKLNKESSLGIGDSNHEKLLTEPISPGETGDKKVGKLKIGLNINVKALLPGASPVKTKAIDNLDGQTQSNVKVENEDSKPVQKVGFVDKLESEILDNKLSKERPRIQVKRRPSTRKARKEAVRKSGINFGEDSTDNSSSLDDPPKIQTEIQTDAMGKLETISNNIIPNEEIVNKIEENDTDIPKDNRDIVKYDNKSIEDEILAENVNFQPVQPIKSNSTTKIVYILNDEDIFNTSTIESSDIRKDIYPESNMPKSSDNQISNTESNLDTNVESQDNLNEETPIKTLGKTYEAPKGDKAKTSLFGDDDDDDAIFRNKTPAVKASIFESDSDGELFGVNKNAQLKKSETVQVKGSLFGDDDDDDLFGVKTKKTNDVQPQSKSVPSVKETTTSTLPVFEDPLSMFGDDE